MFEYSVGSRNQQYTTAMNQPSVAFVFFDDDKCIMRIGLIEIEARFSIAFWKENERKLKKLMMMMMMRWWIRMTCFTRKWSLTRESN